MKLFEKEFFQYQKWNNVEGCEWKMKIVGNSQHTKTEEHARAMAQVAIQMAKKPDIAFVFMNQGINKATGMKHSPNIRLDDLIVYSNGQFEMIEIRSKTDILAKLQLRIGEGMSKLPEPMQGNTKVFEINNILNKSN